MYADVFQKDECQCLFREMLCLSSKSFIYALTTFCCCSVQASLSTVCAQVSSFNLIYTGGLFGQFHIPVTEEQVFPVH